jgi:hypothetical protein
LWKPDGHLTRIRSPVVLLRLVCIARLDAGGGGKMFSQPLGPLNRATLTGPSNERHSLFPALALIKF